MVFKSITKRARNQLVETKSFSQAGSLKPGFQTLPITLGFEHRSLQTGLATLGVASSISRVSDLHRRYVGYRIYSVKLCVFCPARQP